MGSPAARRARSVSAISEVSSGSKRPIRPVFRMSPKRTLSMLPGPMLQTKLSARRFRTRTRVGTKPLGRSSLGCAPSPQTLSRQRQVPKTTALSLAALSTSWM